MTPNRTQITQSNKEHAFKRVKVYNRSGAGNQPFCNLIAISKDAIIDI